MSDNRRSNCQRIQTQLRSGIGKTPGVAPLYGDRSIKLEDGYYGGKSYGQRIVAATLAMR